MRIVVTGGSGRLGRSVVTVLAREGHEVVSLDRAPSPGLPADQHALDLTDATATRDAIGRIRPDAIVHLAAIAVPFSVPDPEMYAVNTGLAWTVLEVALATGVGAVLVASSPTVIGYGAPGWRPATLPINETHPRAPGSAYALSKAAIEDLVTLVARRDAERIRVGWFRPCYVIAPEEWEGAPTQQGHTVAERLDDPALSAVALFNYVDARDVGEFALAWLAATDVPSGTGFFVGAADSLVREPVGSALARLVPGAAEGAAALGPTDPVFSSARAERMLGWRPRRGWRTETILDVPAREAADA